MPDVPDAAVGVGTGAVSATAAPEVFSVVGTRRGFSGRVASVRIDRVVMPGGTIVDREVVEHDRAVAVVALDDDHRVVLIEQYRHPLRRRLWELPAGLMDVEAEPAVQTAARELAEETGFAASSWQLLADIAASPGFTDEAVRIFLARGLTDIGRPAGADDEEADLQVVRVPLAVAVAAVFDGRIVNAAAVAGLLAAAAAVRGDVALRAADDPWTSGPAVVRPDGESARAPALDGPALDGPALDGPVLDGPVLDGPVLDGRG